MSLIPWCFLGEHVVQWAEAKSAFRRVVVPVGVMAPGGKCLGDRTVFLCRPSTEEFLQLMHLRSGESAVVEVPKENASSLTISSDISAGSSMMPCRSAPTAKGTSSTNPDRASETPVRNRGGTKIASSRRILPANLDRIAQPGREVNRHGRIDSLGLHGSDDFLFLADEFRLHPACAAVERTAERTG